VVQAQARVHRLDRLRNLRYHHKLIVSVLIVFGILVAIVALAKDREVLKITSAYGADVLPALVLAGLGLGLAFVPVIGTRMQAAYDTWHAERTEDVRHIPTITSKHRGVAHQENRRLI